MSLVTVGKNGRVYDRKFDHEEARYLKDRGWTYQRLSEYFGVSDHGLRRVLDPNTRARNDRHIKAYMESHREPCLGGCGNRVWRHGNVGRARSGYCPACYGRLFKRISVRVDTLRCCECGEWKPDKEFPKRKDALSRRRRHSTCRSCSAAARQRSRERRKVPCASCGTPRLHPNDRGGARGDDTGLCLDCYRDSVRVEPT